MKSLGLFLLLMTACGSAAETATNVLGPDARCVSSSNDLAYCTIRGVGFICDKHDCVRAPSSPQTLLELDGDRQRKEDEQAQAAQ